MGLFDLFKKNPNGFDYENFEKKLLIAIEECVKHKWSNVDNLYIISIEYFPNFTTFVSIRANTYSNLKEKVGENEKDYIYYKYCEEEWELCEFLGEVSKDLQSKYKEMETVYEDEQFDEIQEEHAVKIFISCKNVMKKFKQTDTYKKLSSPHLNVYMREHFSKNEMIQTFCELNGEDYKEEYSKWL